MRPLAVLLLCSPMLYALPRKGVVDETNPRSPGTPLEIEWRPVKVVLGRGVKRPSKAKYEDGAFDQEILMMRMPVRELAAICQVGRKWVAIEGPHFKVFSSLRATRVKPQDSTFLVADLWRLKEIFASVQPHAMVTTLSQLQRAHLYHIRLERIYSHYRALTGNKEKNLGMGAKYETYLFEDYSEHHILADKFTGRANDKAGLQHHIRDKPNFMMFTTAASQVQGGDKHLSNHVIHNIAHNLVDGHGNFYRETWAFLEEGLAHYYERREQPRTNTFCWTEGRQPSLFQKPKWKPTILNLVRRKKDTPLGQWCEKLQPGELTGTEQGLSWSIIKWMVETDPIRFARMVDKLQDYKNKPSAAECIEYAFGVSPSTLHARWRKYVLEEYGKK